MTTAVPTTEEVREARERVGYAFMDLMAAYQSAKDKSAIWSEDVERRYAPIREAELAMMVELDQRET